MDWIIGGTKDSRDFIDEIEKIDKNSLKNMIVTTVSEYGKILVGEKIKTVAQAMSLKDMEKFVFENNIKRIFDFSHPYAVEVSQNAMEVSKIKNIKYFRFERKMLDYKNSINFYNIDEIINFIKDIDENILVTLGTNNIEKFKNLKNLEKIYFRILPVEISIKKTEEIGIKAKNIIGIQGPFSKEFNEAIYKNYDIKYVITKESGTTGGEQEKIEAAEKLGVISVVLKRPDIKYIWVSSDMKEVLENFKKD